RGGLHRRRHPPLGDPRTRRPLAARPGEQARRSARAQAREHPAVSPADSRGRELLTEESERVLARQAAVAALTAVGRMRTDAGVGTVWAGSGPVAAGAGADAGPGGGGPGVTGAGGTGGASGLGPTSGGGSGSRVGRPVGFASPERAVRRRTRGGWAARG